MSNSVVSVASCGTDTPNRSTRASHLAAIAHKEGINVTLFLLDEAVYLVKKGLIEQLEAATGDWADKLMTCLQAHNVPIIACAPWVMARRCSEADLHRRARLGTAAERIKLTADAAVISLSADLRRSRC